MSICRALFVLRNLCQFDLDLKFSRSIIQYYGLYRLQMRHVFQSHLLCQNRIQVYLDTNYSTISKFLFFFRQIEVAEICILDLALHKSDMDVKFRLAVSRIWPVFLRNDIAAARKRCFGDIGNFRLTLCSCGESCLSQ